MRLLKVSVSLMWPKIPNKFEGTKKSVYTCFLVIILATFASASSDPVTKESIDVQGKKRTYYLCVPTRAESPGPAPLIVLLHGTRGNGGEMIAAWKELAGKEGIILVGPDSLDGEHWSIPEDAPEFLWRVIESIKTRFPVNSRRVYLFGHSAGANGAIPISLFESEYFAATVISAGALRQERYGLVSYAKRKVPFAFFVGTEDPFYPVAVVRATSEALEARGFPVQFKELSHHDHSYRARANEINRLAWDFLSRQELKQDQHYTAYSFQTSEAFQPSPADQPPPPNASVITGEDRSAVPIAARSRPALTEEKTVVLAEREIEITHDSDDEETDIIRVNTSLVNIPVSIVDRDGKYIPGLQASDFHVFEDRVERNIAYFASIEKPFTVALMLDVSDSTRFRLVDIQQAAISFVEQLRPDDRVIVIAFDRLISPLSEITNDREVLRKAIARAATGGGTALYNAVDLTLKQILSPVQGRKAIVLFTDGVDTGSAGASLASTLRDAEESEALVYTIHYHSGAGSYGVGIAGRLNAHQASQYLMQLAAKTGGRYFVADTIADVGHVFAHVAAELRQQYSLGFYAETSERPTRHELQIRLNRPNVVVRARRYYISVPRGPQKND